MGRRGESIGPGTDDRHDDAILVVVLSLVPSAGRASDSLLIEMLTAVFLAGGFSLTAGCVASWHRRRLANGAIGGGATALVNLGVLLLALGAADRHFRSIRGPDLVVHLPLAVPLGATLGVCGALLPRA